MAGYLKIGFSGIQYSKAQLRSGLNTPVSNRVQTRRPIITILVLNEFIYRAIEGHASLLFAHKTDIRKIDLDRHNSMVSIVNDTRSSCAIDYNFRTGMIYWSDVMTQKIYK